MGDTNLLEEARSFFADRFTEVVQRFGDVMIAYSSSLLSTALLFCGIGTLIYLLVVFIIPLMRGSEISIESVFRPFMITFLLMFYPEIMGAINGTFTYISIEMDKAVVETMEDNSYYAQVESVERYKAQQDSLSYVAFAKAEMDKKRLEKLNTPDKNNGGKVNEAEVEKSTFQITKLIEEFKISWIRDTIGSIFTWFVNLLTSFARNVVLLTSRFLLAILIMIGPLAIAFSIFPNWQEGLNSFFSRLFGFYMWYPVALCLDLVFHFGLGILFQVFEWNPAWQYTITTWVSLIAIFTYFSVPAIAGWIVPNGGGDGGALAGIKQATSMAIGYISGQAGKVIGSHVAMSKKLNNMGGNVGSGGQKS